MARRVCVVEHKFADEFDVKFDGSDPRFLEEIAVAVLKVFQSRGANVGKIFRRIPGAVVHDDTIILPGTTRRI